MTDSYDVLIVGAGHGGAQAAIALRQKGFTGSIAVLGEEPELPYERPPLSKDYLSREKSFERILIRPAAFWAERNVAMLTGRRIVSVDPVGHVAVDTHGAGVGYGSLIWATGGHARKLSCAGFDLTGVHTVRTRADVDRLFGELDATTRVAVVGGGYIGLEAAAVLAKAGKQVTVLEAQDRLLARVAGVALSRFFEAEHRAHDVDIRFGVQVVGIEGDGARASGVRLGDGTVVAAEMVIVGIGIVPAVEPLLVAGAAGGNGVAVDEHCATTLPDIYAIGDCALHHSRFAGGAAVRLESVQNANDMATTAAAAIVGAPKVYDAVPWFWSNQYDIKLQTVGLSIGHDAEIVRGDPASRSFSVLYLKQGRVVALDCINSVRDYVQGRALVTGGATIDPAELADASRPLKDMLAAPSERALHA